MALIKDISGICGVSKSTVSKALRGYPDVGEETRQLILKTARELDLLAEQNGGKGSAGSQNAESIRCTNSIGILLPGAGKKLEHPYYWAVIHGICRAAQENGCDVSILLDDRSGLEEMGYLAKILYRKMDGVCVLCDEKELYERDMVELFQSEVPVVLIGHSAEGVETVRTDRRESMQTLLSYLYRMGHRRISFIHEEGEDGRQLESYFLVSAALMGLDEKRCRTCAGGKSRNRRAMDTGILALHLMEEEQPPSCIVLDSMERGMETALYLRGKGVKIPGDISLAVFSMTDEQMPENSRRDILWDGSLCLTAVMEHPGIIGYEAGRRLIRLTRSPKETLRESVRLTGEMVIGNTVKAVKTRSELSKKSG